MDARKRGRPEAGGNANGGFKKSRQEMDSLSTGVGSKSKPCTKFFSTNGCPFGESCHFLHYVPGGYNAVSQLMNRSSAPPMPRNVPTPPPMSYGHTPPAPPYGGSSSSSPSIKNRMCNKYNSAEGCKYGDKCHFAHGDWELGRAVAPSHDDPRMMGGPMPPMPGRMGGMRMDHPPHQPGPVPGFGDTATTKISVDSSLAGAIIGKGGVNSKQICRQTGVKLSIRDHETDPNLRNIELDGTLEQVGRASAMVRELIGNISHGGGQGRGGSGASGEKQHPGSNYKTKICDNFNKGTCSFGQRCHFAHGAAELRSSGPGGV